MKIDRRTFVSLFAFAIASACGGKMPDAPTSIPEPRPAPQPQPSPASPYGNFYREGFAGISGNLEEVLKAARLEPKLNNLGLLVELDGRAAPLVAGAAASNGCYFYHVRGSFVGNAPKEIQLSPGDSWSLFDWNGSSPV